MTENNHFTQKRFRVLVACEFSGVVRNAFNSLGHQAVSCDILPTHSPGPHIQDDVLNHLNEGWDLMIAHPDDSPQWVIEVRKEIKRLQRRIAGIQKKIDSDRQTSYDYEDLDNWTGWLHGLKWCLKMREGKATRRDAWGRS